MPLRFISRFIFFFLAAGITSLTVFGQSAPQAQVEVFSAPAVGVTVTRHITVDGEQVFELELAKDEFVEINVRQSALEVGLKVFNAKGETLSSFFNPGGVNALQEIVLIAPETGTYRFSVKSTNPSEQLRTTPHQYTLLIKTRKPATEKDRGYFLAWQARAIVTTEPDTRPAILLAQEAAAIYRKLGDREGEAESLLQVSRAQLYADDLEASVISGTQSLALFRELPEKRRQTRILNVLGTALTQIGEYYKALEYIKEAISITRAVKNEFALADSLKNLGTIYTMIGDDRAAIEYYEQARAIFEKLNASTYLLVIDMLLGGALARTGNLPRAIEKLEAASLELTDSKADDTPTLLGVQVNLIDLYSRQKNWNKAFSNLEKTEKILARTSGFQTSGLEAQIQFVAGLLYFDTGNPEESARRLRRSINLAKSSGFHSVEIDAMTGLARTEYGLGNFDEALKLVTEAIDRTEAIRGGLEDEQLRTTYLGSVQSRYELFYTLLMELHRRQPTAGNDAKAFLVSERAKARTLIDILRTKSISTNADQAVILKRRKLQSRINEGNRTLYGLSNSPEDVKRRAELEKELAAAVEEYRDLTTQLQKLNPKFVRLTEPVALDLAEIRNQLDDSVLLEYALGTEKSYLWAVTKTGLKSYELPGRATIEDLTRKTYDALTARARKVRFEEERQQAARIAEADGEYRTLSNELGQLLLGPVAGDLAGKNVLVVGDGALLYLPFAALPLPTTGKPLVAACKVTQLPSISTLSVLRQDAAGRKPAARTVAVFADPVFETGDPRVRTKKTKASAPASPSPVRDDVTRAAAEIDGADRDGALVRLPFTRAEADAIGKLVPANRRRISLDFKASRESVFNQDLSGYRFVHFATHGLLNSATPDLSGVVLSMVDKSGKPTDGFVHAYEVFNLKLPVEMVVLSGCRTGLGKEIRGEGMIGLTRAFLYAGAERVLVSLWAVEDSATSTLMADTYAGMLNRKLRPAAALRAAQLKMMADPKHAHPFYWAAFTLQGDPR
jgi:CHAT domain-containing protein